MNINTRQVQGVTVIELLGDLTWKSAPEAQERLLEYARADAKIVIDMSGVPYLSSAGLRTLLVVYRAVNAAGGRVLLVALSQDIRDTMELTGFLDLFTHRDTLESGIAELTS
jgi:anti-sigma B factor antagonist